MTQVTLRMPASGGDKTVVIVAAGSSISTDVARVLLDDANATNKQQVLDGLEAIRQRVIEGPWPLG